MQRVSARTLYIPNNAAFLVIFHLGRWKFNSFSRLVVVIVRKIVLYFSWGNIEEVVEFRQVHRFSHSNINLFGRRTKPWDSHRWLSVGKLLLDLVKVTSWPSSSLWHILRLDDPWPFGIQFRTLICLVPFWEILKEAFILKGCPHIIINFGGHCDLATKLLGHLYVL